MLQDDSFSENISKELTLHKLLDAALELRMNETSQLIAQCEELMRDKSKHLTVSSFVWRKVGYRANHIELSFTFDSHKDLAVWKHLLAVAIAYQPFAQPALKTFQNTVLLTVLSCYAREIRYFVRLCAHITHFEHVKYGNVDGVQIATVATRQSLLTFIEMVIEKQNDELEQLQRQCERLKKRQQRVSCIMHTRRNESSDETSFTFACICQEERIVWKSCFTSVLAQLNSPEVSLTARSETDTVTLKNEDLKSILEDLKPLAERTDFQIISFTNIQPRLINILSDFFENGSASSIEFDQKEQSIEHFELSLDLVRKLQPSKVNYHRTGQSDEIAHFLVPLASIVDEIHINEYIEYKKDLQPMPLSAIKKIMSSKCNNLMVYGYYGKGTVITVAEAETLIQFLNHIGKRKALNIRTCGEPMEVQIGEYSLKIASTSIIIQHLNLAPKPFW